MIRRLWRVLSESNDSLSTIAYVDYFNSVSCVSTDRGYNFHRAAATLKVGEVNSVVLTVARSIIEMQEG